MQAAKKIESFVVDANETRLFYGTLSGQIVTLALPSFDVIDEIQAHPGSIVSLAIHPSLSFLACLSMDRTVSIWSTSETTLRTLGAASIRNLRVNNDVAPYQDIRSNAQALAFHPVEKILATRTASGAIAELRFDDRGYFSLIRCTRFHEKHDSITVRYSVSPPYYLMSGSGGGEAVLALEGRTVRRWQIERESIHWFEHFAGNHYLVASDARLLARLDISTDAAVKIGSQFGADDFEHVAVNLKSKAVYASSFDRHVYELDPETCEPIKVVFSAPFKCRWIYSLSSAPARLLVQVRDGSLFDVDIVKNEVVHSIRTSPKALWTAISTNHGKMTIFGEGDRLVDVDVSAPIDTSTIPMLSVIATRRGQLPVDGYIKRAVYDRKTGTSVLGHSSGTVLIFGPKGELSQVHLAAAVRDVVLGTSGFAYAATEAGTIFKIDCARSSITARYASTGGNPIWALALHPSERTLVAFERYGRILFLESDNLECSSVMPDSGRCKRAKWVDSHRLLFSYGGEVRILDADKKIVAGLVAHAGNTVEDFIWDTGQNYLVCINYLNMVGLYDFRDGEKLSEAHDQIDYSKGLIWINETPVRGFYPLDFITFGRSGTVHLFRIHNEHLMALGAIRCRDRADVQEKFYPARVPSQASKAAFA
jgi:WD40 repeat protein